MNEQTAKGAFWGLFLLALGLFLLLDNMNVIDFSWHTAFKLWPLIFIFWGINLLPGNETVKLIIRVIVLAAAFYWIIKFPDSSYRWGEFYPDTV